MQPNLDCEHSDWFDQVYPALSGHGLWLRGGELNTLTATEYEKKPFRVLFSRLSTYRDTANSFTHKFLYQIAAGMENIFVDLAYLPPPKDSEIMSRDHIPWLLATGSKRGPHGFDLLGFSNSIVQELVNIGPLLRNSNIPLGKQARLADPAIPIVILGGANSIHATALFAPDPLVDGIFAGEDTGCVQEILEICRDGKLRRDGKRRIIDNLLGVPGFIEPDNPQKTRRSRSALPTGHTFLRGPVVYEGDQAGKANLQISEGCPCFCSFCSESWVRKPYRELTPAQIRSSAMQIKAEMGADDLEIYSFNFNMHRKFYRILWDLAGAFNSIGLKSQRFDYLAEDPELLKCLHAIGKTSLTCGLEGISDRLRRYLHKSLERDVLSRSLSILLRSPLREIKVFLIATGLETENDFAEFKDLLRNISLSMQTIGRKPRIIFSMTPLVRFPWTPLEFEDAPLPELVRTVLLQTERIVNGHGFEFRSSADQNEYFLSQIMARAADCRIGEAVFRAAGRMNFIYYREVSPGLIEAVREELQEAGITIESALKGAPADAENPGSSPWKLIDTGVDRKFLYEKWQHAREFRDEGYCLGTLDQKGVCSGCNACADETGIAEMNAVREERPYPVPAFIEHVKADARDIREVSFAVRIHECARGVGAKMIAVALARAFMLVDPALVEGYRGFRGSAFERQFASAWVTGDDTITLGWRSAAAARAEMLAGDPVFLEKVNLLLQPNAEFLGLAETTPKTYELSFDSPYPFEPADYLTEKRLKHTLIRKGVCRIYQFTSDSLKKKVLKSLSSENCEENGVRVCLTAAERFVAEEFLAGAFRIPTPDDRVRIKMVARALQ